MPIRMPAGAEFLLETLKKSGYSAYIVGGCVRDSLLGIVPKDWDVCTSAKPQEVKACLSDQKIIETGLKHGTVMVLLPDGQYEVTTFRIDGPYTDHRRPDSVAFITDIEADLARRDFTVNAMAYNEKEGLIDPFGGRDCLAQGIIRCVGDPQRRFCEDGLRIMRAIRFACVYGFSIDPDTAAAIHDRADLLQNIAAERIREELCKLLAGKGVSEILLAYRDVMAVILPETEGTDAYKSAALSLSRYRGAETCVRMALLLRGLSDRSEETADGVMRRLRFDNKTRRDTVELLSLLSAATEPTEKAVRHLLAEIGTTQFFRLAACKTALLSEEEADGAERRRIEEACGIAGNLIASGQYVTLDSLAVKGDDLLSAGVPEGSAVGRLLKTALDAVLDGTVPNHRDDLMRYLSANGGAKILCERFDKEKKI